jgi:crotonobetainyl-CoA:carnitine CoA-transferase CaiB-like acyl-CoA transferase
VGPLDGVTVIIRASGVAAAYAGRMLGTMGAAVTLLEPEGGSPLRQEPPFLSKSDIEKSVHPERVEGLLFSSDVSKEGQPFDKLRANGKNTVSALFAYHTAGMTCIETDDPEAHLGNADIFIHDTPLKDRAALRLDEASLTAKHPSLIHVSVLPFGASGPKADWKAEEINILHSSGEGNLLPNGLTNELFPERPPVKPYGHFAEMQGGIAAALGALSALWVRETQGGQYVDISCQDATLAVGAFAIQRFGDGQVENRFERAFRYGGVIPCADGYVELLTLEQRQWEGLVELLGSPDWARDPALSDSLERSLQGPMINTHIREWAVSRNVLDIVREGQRLGVPLAKFNTPAEVLADPHERARGLFQKVDVPGAGVLDMLVSPFHFHGAPLVIAQ